MNQEHFRKDEIVFKQGDLSHCAYRVIEGEVEILQERTGKTIQLATLGAGEI